MIDPITLEVLREALVSIVREMRVTLVRTAYSSILYEGEDFSCVLMDGRAQIVAMSKGQDHPLHIVPVGWSMKAVREKFGDDIHPGDIFLHNEPYTGGTHLNDVAMIYPLFTHDGEMFVFPVVRAHWGDVGGMSPGSLSGRATEIFQEGVRIPPIRIVDRGRPNDAALDLIFSNMRGPRERRGDFQAMLGTCRKAAERIEELTQRYGEATIRDAVAELMDRAEGRMRRAIRGLRPGEYVYEAHLEAGTERLEPLTVRARVTVAGDTITVDLAGTSPQTLGPTNDTNCPGKMSTLTSCSASTTTVPKRVRNTLPTFSTSIEPVLAPTPLARFRGFVPSIVSLAPSSLPCCWRTPSRSLPRSRSSGETRWATARSAARSRGQEAACRALRAPSRPPAAAVASGSRWRRSDRGALGCD